MGPLQRPGASPQQWGGALLGLGCSLLATKEAPPEAFPFQQTLAQDRQAEASAPFPGGCELQRAKPLPPLPPATPPLPQKGLTPSPSPQPGHASQRSPLVESCVEGIDGVTLWASSLGARPLPTPRRRGCFTPAGMHTPTWTREPEVLRPGLFQTSRPRRSTSRSPGAGQGGRTRFAAAWLWL